MELLFEELGRDGEHSWRAKQRTCFDSTRNRKNLIYG